MTDISTEAVKELCRRISDGYATKLTRDQIATLTALATERDAIKASNAKLCEAADKAAEKLGEYGLFNSSTDLRQAIAEARQVQS